MKCHPRWVTSVLLLLFSYFHKALFMADLHQNKNNRIILATWIYLFIRINSLVLLKSEKNWRSHVLASVKTIFSPQNRNQGQLLHFRLKFNLSVSCLSIIHSEFTGQDGKMLGCDKHNRVITCVFCREFIRHWSFFTLLQRDLFKQTWSLADSWNKIIVITLVTQGLPSSCCL